MRGPKGKSQKKKWANALKNNRVCMQSKWPSAMHPDTIWWKAKAQNTIEAICIQLYKQMSKIYEWAETQKILKSLGNKRKNKQGESLKYKQGQCHKYIGGPKPKK